MPSQPRTVNTIVLCAVRILLGALILLAAAVRAEDVIRSYELGGDGSRLPRMHLLHSGFLLKHDLDDNDKITLLHRDDALHLQVREEAFGIMLHEDEIHGAGRLRLHWGVLDYPDGASYEHGIDNEAVMVYVFFGHEKFSSGSLLLPKSPYFIGFYLCRDGTDELEKPYQGNYYHAAGRFICVAHPPEGATVVTEIDLHEEFQKSFGLAQAPSVSAVSIEVDTTDSRNDGKAAAFIERIEFLP